MQLFTRRPFALSCFLFMLTTLLIYTIEYEIKIAFIIAFLILTALFFIMCFIVKSKVRIFAFLTVACIFIVGAISTMAFGIDLKEQKAMEYLGPHKIVATVTDEVRSSKKFDAYDVEIVYIDGDKVSIPAFLVCEFRSVADVGDKIYCNAEIIDISSSSYARLNENGENCISVEIGDPSFAKVVRFDREMPFFEKLFEKDGFRVITDEVKSFISERLEVFIGGSSGALAKGVLVGDVSDIADDVARDFRRSGVFHIFSVSGLHISILLGAIDLLLKKLYVPKLARCAIVSFFGFFLLCLTGFAMSALRAVFMLWLVYINFLFSENADGVTSLFSSITAIILIYPYSVFELGMWMSFLATLGLVLVYPAIVERLPRISRKEKGIRYRAKKLLMAALLIVIMSVIASFFMLPISYEFFGEVSLVAPLTNVALSFVTTLFLIFVSFVVVFGSVPIISVPLIVVARGCANMMIGVTGFFSEMEYATVSLRYPFAKIYVTIFVLAFAVMLVIRLKNVWFISIPCAAFTAVFFISVLIFNLTCGNYTTYYYRERGGEILSVGDDTNFCIVDNSDGNIKEYKSALDDAACLGVGDVDTLILTNVSSAHLRNMDYFLRSNLVRCVFVPETVTDEQKTLSNKLKAIADGAGVPTYIYRSGDEIHIDGDLSVTITYIEIDGSFFANVYVKGRYEMIAYISRGDSADNGYTSLTSKLIVGKKYKSINNYSSNVSDRADVVFANEDIVKAFTASNNLPNRYLGLKPEYKIKFSVK